MISKKISLALGAREPEFSHKIKKLEELSGNQGHDIRLAIQMQQSLNNIAEKLHLDKNDTTLKEMYHGLTAAAKKDSIQLGKTLQIKDDDLPEQVVKKCVTYLENRISDRLFWCLKNSTAKKQLKENPPKKLMKALGLRSVDSLLKRESVTQILIFAASIENSAWLKKHIDQARSLTNSDFNEQKINFEIVTKAWRQNLRKSNIDLSKIIFSHTELPTVVIAPPNKRFDYDVLFYFDSLINHINGIVLRSSFFRYKGVHPNFFETMSTIRSHGFRNVALLHEPFNWSSVVHTIKRKNNSNLAEKLDLNVEPSDFHTLSTAEELDRNSIWKNDLLHADDNGASVSSNLSDVILNAVNNYPWEKSYKEYGKNKLQDELFSRYLNHNKIIDSIFESQSVDEEEEF